MTLSSVRAVGSDDVTPPPCCKYCISLALPRRRLTSLHRSIPPRSPPVTLYLSLFLCSYSANGQLYGITGLLSHSSICVAGALQRLVRKCTGAGGGEREKTVDWTLCTLHPSHFLPVSRCASFCWSHIEGPAAWLCVCLSLHAGNKSTVRWFISSCNTGNRALIGTWFLFKVSTKITQCQYRNLQSIPFLFQ